MNIYPELKLSKVLAALIKTRGLTITSLSRLTKVPLQTLHGWLQGNEPRSIRQVKKVADFFGVDLDYLCFEIQTKRRKEDILNNDKLIVFEIVVRELVDLSISENNQT